MTIITAVLQACRWIWFLGCTITWKIRGRILVEGMGIRSPEFFMLCLYSIGIISFWCFPAPGKGILAGVLMLWLCVQRRCHWYYTLFGASPLKLKGYNDCFRDTIRIFPASDTRIIPDLYHILMHVMIIANLVFCLIR